MATDQPYHRTGRDGLTARERDMQRRGPEPADASSQILQRLTALESKFARLRGDGNIQVNGEVITLANTQVLGAGTGTQVVVRATVISEGAATAATITVLAV